jgi:hypothetical protein
MPYLRQDLLAILRRKVRATSLNEADPRPTQMHHIANRRLKVVVSRTAPNPYTDCRPSIDWLLWRKRTLELDPFLAVVIDVHPVRSGHATHDGDEVVVAGSGTYRYLDHGDSLVAIIG